MEVLNKIREHSVDFALSSLEIVETISNDLETHEIGKIVRTKNQLLCIPETPLGLHMSVHDADEKHPMARIHQRIPSGKGIFQIYPPGSELGNTIGQVDIPPFSQIKGTILLPPEPPGLKLGPALISVQTLWQQSSILKDRSNKSRRIINLDSDITSVSGIGTQYFFVEPGNLDSLIKWFSDRDYMFVRVELTADVFRISVPWLAVVFARGDLSASKPGV